MADNIKTSTPLLNEPREEEGQALHFFLYLVSFFSLGMAVSGVIATVFAFIEKFVEDATSYDFYSSSMGESAIKYGISSIVIAGAVYLLSASYINRLLYRGSIFESSRARKWLTYIVMFVATATILGDLVAVLSNFLGGDLALRFFLKALTILIASGAVLGFYLWDMKKREIVGKKYRANLFSGIALVVVFLILIVAPFFFISNPFEARRLRLDDATVDKLRNVDNSIQNYWETNKKKLPVSLEKIIKDATSGDTYYYLREEDVKAVQYSIKNKEEYELCADFLADSREEIARASYYDKQWQHQKGTQCFTRKVNDKGNINNPPLESIKI